MFIATIVVAQVTEGLLYWCYTATLSGAASSGVEGHVRTAEACAWAIEQEQAACFKGVHYQECSSAFGLRVASTCLSKETE